MKKADVEKFFYYFFKTHFESCDALEAIRFHYFIDWYEVQQTCDILIDGVCYHSVESIEELSARIGSNLPLIEFCEYLSLAPIPKFAEFQKKLPTEFHKDLYDTIILLLKMQKNAETEIAKPFIKTNIASMWDKGGIMHHEYFDNEQWIDKDVRNFLANEYYKSDYLYVVVNRDGMVSIETDNNYE